MALLDRVFANPKKHNRIQRVLSYVAIPDEDRFPVNIVKPNLKHGPWIAGGAPLLWFQNITVKSGDIDVFCKNEAQANKLIDFINSLDLTEYNGYASKIIQTKNATTFQVYCDSPGFKGDWRIQIITCRYFNTCQEVIDNFDITVCQVATCGNEWILGDQTAYDIANRNLRFRQLTKDAPKRLVKYWTYGYTPVENTLEQIINNVDTNWNFRGEEEYHNVF
jgi:hypothetical protein